MAWTKMKTTIVAGVCVLLAAGTTSVVVQHYRTLPVSKTDLSASEVRDAVAVLQRERLMWSQLTNMSAHISIESDKKENGQITDTDLLEGDMSLRRIILSQAEKIQGDQRWEMTISNTLDGWSCTTDGSRANTKIVCPDKQMAQRLEKLTLWGLIGSFVIPEQLLTQLYRDSLFSKATQTLDQMLSHGFAIYHNQQVQGAQQAYTYKTPSGIEFSFVSGHISGYKWPLGQNTQVAESFGSPIESNHFWYPTQIHAEISKRNETGSETIMLSNVVINGSPM